MGFERAKSTIYLDIDYKDSCRFQYRPDGEDKYLKEDIVSGMFTGLWTKTFEKEDGSEIELLKVRIEDSTTIFVLTLFLRSSLAENLLNSLRSIEKPYGVKLWLKAYRKGFYEAKNGEEKPNPNLVVMINNKQSQWYYPVATLPKDRDERNRLFDKFISKIRERLNTESTYDDKAEQSYTAEDETKMILSDDVPF